MNARETVKVDANNAGKEIIIKGKDVKENISDEYANGKGDGQVLTYSPSREGKLTTMSTTPTWHSSTDLYNYYWSVQPRLSTESDSRVGSSPYDIDLIQVRGRVWKDNSRIVDQTRSTIVQTLVSFGNLVACYVVGSILEEEITHIKMLVCKVIIQ
ncbi:MAG: hypothetical protein QG646_1359 [Euryarchaeota archaeon]|nr:hypothetical protein [Euryarchaeota archaeon]